MTRVQGNLELNMARVTVGREENERLRAQLARDKEDEALMRQDLAAQQAYTQALLAGDTCATCPAIAIPHRQCLAERSVPSW